ncbi:hypothetical protein HDF19_00095 [Mucilaginibacter sp. E4BP6]|uniref:hypothetical protein n=1 Tax=Mucilaginibacter sp. E4BP6 TaxID=2723089 RepID=UPI0015CAA435|nr:hypothetical protein [Mucilaginibacter sp. E4BP6]NYE67998.1 hypothetical protein [Mucilaginibacter sp. E4BP6]
MTINEQLINDLGEAITNGKPWVAYNVQDGNELHPNSIRVFASALEAERYCEENNNAFDFAEQVFNFDNYIYMQAVTLKASLALEKQLTNPVAIDTSAIARQMAEQSLYLPAGKSIDDLEASFLQGLVFPVIWQRLVDPLKEIAEYHVIAHQHNGGMIYEIGHSRRALESFSSLREARTFMDSAVLFNELAGKEADYLIVGRFHGQQLELDVEGYAVPHSGLTLVTAHHNYENGHDYYELHSLSEKAVISQYFFLGLKDEKIVLYNDKLEPTGIDQPQQPFYTKHLINNYLPFKNSSIMNEQSFDYVKNQLFYLGFGEEVAKPLREKMEQNLTEFTVPHTRKFGQDETNSILHFSKGDQLDKDMTFFNRADITLKQPGKEDLTQTFFFGKEHNYTLQERYNMMDGRAAYREQPKMAPVEENGEVKMKPTGETYYAWRGLDFKNADQYGNFNPKVMFWNHQKEVGKYPIKGIEENYDKQRLIAKLEKGNKVDVILLRDGHETQVKLVANPRMARLDFYDSNGQSLIVRKVEKQAVDQTQKVEMTPQEVQKAAIVRAAEQKPDQSQQPGTPTQGQQNGQAQEQPQKESVKQEAAAEQRQEQTQRRRQGARL